jgi:hypothetical protein
MDVDCEAVPIDPQGIDTIPTSVRSLKNGLHRLPDQQGTPLFPSDDTPILTVKFGHLLSFSLRDSRVVTGWILAAREDDEKVPTGFMSFSTIKHWLARSPGNCEFQNRSQESQLKIRCLTMFRTYAFHRIYYICINDEAASTLVLRPPPAFLRKVQSNEPRHLSQEFRSSKLPRPLQVLEYPARRTRRVYLLYSRTSFLKKQSRSLVILHDPFRFNCSTIKFSLTRKVVKSRATYHTSIKSKIEKRRDRAPCLVVLRDTKVKGQQSTFAPPLKKSS